MILLGLVKLFLVVACTVSFGITFTPPNGLRKTLPPILSLRGLSPEVREWFLLFASMYMFPIELTLYCLASINEIILILSQTFPSSSSSHTTQIELPSLFLLGVFLSISGGAIRFMCYRALADSYRFELVRAGELSQKPSSQYSPKLVQTGPYSVVRHPGYAGGWINLIGSIVVDFAPHSWIHGHGIGIKMMAYTWVVFWKGMGGLETACEV
uniref:Protein-S-isoprenylcysteine O-methyltransferase n=1 Tax=Moniliophthora roreri TaxID=221103 RepID=A0A0W0F007_MONRR